MPNLPNGTKGVFKPGLTRLRVRHSTTELPRSNVSNERNIVNILIRLIFDSSNTLVYRLGTSKYKQG